MPVGVANERLNSIAIQSWFLDTENTGEESGTQSGSPLWTDTVLTAFENGKFGRFTDNVNRSVVDEIGFLECTF